MLNTAGPGHVGDVQRLAGLDDQEWIHLPLFSQIPGRVAGGAVLQLTHAAPALFSCDIFRGKRSRLCLRRSEQVPQIHLQSIKHFFSLPSTFQKKGGAKDFSSGCEPTVFPQPVHPKFQTGSFLKNFQRYSGP